MTLPWNSCRFDQNAAHTVGGWSPASVFNYAWEADTGVTDAGAGRVSAWVDYIGSVSLTQGTSGNRPLYSATGFNTTKPGITFVFTRPDFLSNTSFTLASTTLSVFMLFHATTANEVNSGWISCQSNSPANDFFGPGWVVSCNDSGGVDESAFMYSAGPLSGADVVWTGAIPAAMLFGCVADGANATTYKDGVSYASSAFTGTLGGSPNVLSFGSRPWNGNTPSADGTIAGIFIKVGITSPTDIANLVTYVNGKYGTAF